MGEIAKKALALMGLSEHEEITRAVYMMGEEGETGCPAEHQAEAVEVWAWPDPEPEEPGPVERHCVHTPEQAELLGWLDGVLLPDLPFMFRPGHFVVDGERFMVSLRRDIELGEGGPRWRTGALQQDIEWLKRTLH